MKHSGEFKVRFGLTEWQEPSGSMGKAISIEPDEGDLGPIEGLVLTLQQHDSLSIEEIDETIELLNNRISAVHWHRNK